MAWEEETCADAEVTPSPHREASATAGGHRVCFADVGVR
jgi:hypothetical protein